MLNKQPSLGCDIHCNTGCRFSDLVCYHSFQLGLELLLLAVHHLFFLDCIKKISNLELFL